MPIIKPRKDEIKSPGPSSLTVEEVQRVIKYMQTEPLKWRVMFLLLADTGIRRGECCAVHWENIDFKTGAVTIAGNLCYTPEKDVYLDTPKNGKKRIVYVDDDTLDMLRALRQE